MKQVNKGHECIGISVGYNKISARNAIQLPGSGIAKRGIDQHGCCLRSPIRGKAQIGAPAKEK